MDHETIPVHGISKLWIEVRQRQEGPAQRVEVDGGGRVGVLRGNLAARCSCPPCAPLMRC